MFRVFCFVLGFLGFVTWGTTRIVWNVQVNRNLTGHLALAAAANSIDLAKQEMQTAVSAMERYGMTSGYTSVLWTTPSENVGFWYANLRAALMELETVTPQTSNLERSNILLKLHETINAHKDKEADVFAPEGITAFPNNGLVALWGWASVVLMLFAFGGNISIRR